MAMPVICRSVMMRSLFARLLRGGRGHVPKFRHLIEAAPALGVHGQLQREERSVNVIAEAFENLPVASAAEGRVHSFG